MKFDAFFRHTEAQPPPLSESFREKSKMLFLPPPSPEQRTREMSPREIAAFAYEKYLSGALDWSEYRMLGFPAELHPAFNETIGALTGERADPDRPRDILAEWRGHLGFAHRHNADDPDLIRRIERILEVIK